MCCEECPKYEKCEEDNILKDNCCTKCPEYYNCVGANHRERSSYRRGSYNENYLED